VGRCGPTVVQARLNEPVSRTVVEIDCSGRYFVTPGVAERISQDCVVVDRRLAQGADGVHPLRTSGRARSHGPKVKAPMRDVGAGYAGADRPALTGR
jgi:hypothetical protein